MSVSAGCITTLDSQVNVLVIEGPAGVHDGYGYLALSVPHVLCRTKAAFALETAVLYEAGHGRSHADAFLGNLASVLAFPHEPELVHGEGLVILLGCEPPHADIDGFGRSTSVSI